MPELAVIGNDIFGGGLGLKDAAIIAFFLSVGLLVLFALVAGDGLLGEVQFLLASYVGMFVINWLLIAWIFYTIVIAASSVPRFFTRPTTTNAL